MKSEFHTCLLERVGVVFCATGGVGWRTSIKRRRARQQKLLDKISIRISVTSRINDLQRQLQ